MHTISFSHGAAVKNITLHYSLYVYAYIFPIFPEPKY